MVDADASGELGETRSFKVVAPGTVVSHYEIIEKLGEGGMGVVYRAEDTKLERHVALKFLPPHLTLDDEAKQRFVQEARTASALDHPNICTIYEIGETGDRRMYIAMACYDGETLRERIERGPLDLADAVEIAAQVASGLLKAHGKGIVHRDIKPANIIITTDGLAKIMDFGLAKLSGGVGLTGTGTAMGTVAYMSPEQAGGEHVDQRSDIWSLGAVIYEMVTGKRPFRGEHEQAVIHSILNEEPEPAGRLRPDLPDAIERIINKALSKNADSRYRDASEMLGDLETARGSLVSGGTAIGHPKDSPEPSIIVLPFANLSPDPDEEYFCDGITEELINALTQIEGLRVVARTTSFALKGKHEDIRDVGRRLNVETVLEGSVRKSGDRLRITAQVVNVADGYHLWSEKFDRDLKDVFAIQDEISEQIARKLRVDLVGGEAAAARHVGDVEAYNLYLRGRYFWNKRTKDGLERGIECFKEAIARSPDYALAYVGLADCYFTLMGFGFSRPKEYIGQAEAAVEKALKLDDALAEAHTSAAWIKGFYRLDWMGAEAEYKRSIQLNPKYATAHHWYALHLAVTGRPDDAIAEAETAQELDPLSLMIGTALGTVLFLARRYDRAIDVLKRVLEMDPGFAPAKSFLAGSYLEKGMSEKALRMMEDLVANVPDKPKYMADLASIYARSGNHAKAEQLYNELESISNREYVPAYNMAQLCACLGKKEEAFTYLDVVMDEVFGVFLLKVDPVFDALRSDPRFTRLLQKAGLTE